MKKILSIVGLLFLGGILTILLFSFIPVDESNDNITAEAQEDRKRFITVINNTQQISKELVITIDDGTEIVSEEDYSKKSASFEIPQEYAEHSHFSIKLTDRYNAVYEKGIDIDDSVGRYEVSVNQEDKIKDGSLLDRISQLFNGD